MHTDYGTCSGYLIHFGILGQKWGVRRYQNEDGTLTEEGKKRYKEQSELLAAAKYHALKDADNYKKSAQESEETAKMLRDGPIDKGIEYLWGDKRSALITEDHDEDRIAKIVRASSDDYLRDAKNSKEYEMESLALLEKLANMQVDVSKDTRQLMKEIEDLFSGDTKGLYRYVTLGDLRSDIARYNGLSDSEKKRYADEEKKHTNASA